MDTVSVTVATSPSLKVLSSSLSPVSWPMVPLPEVLPVMAEDALLSADNSSSSRFSRLRTLPSAASTVRSMSSLSSVTSETLALLCSAAAICIYT